MGVAVTDIRDTNALAAMESLVSKEGDILCVVLINQDKIVNLNELVSLLSHEVVHLWQKVIEVMEEYDPSDEFMAYSIQFMMSDILGEYYRQCRVFDINPK